MAIGDRFAILNHGRLVGIFNKEEVDEYKLLHLMAGGEELDNLKEEMISK
jgi:simple sugar transport system ATP-binding protein